MTTPTHYIVRGLCGREWRIPAGAVRADFKECIQAMDGLTNEETEAYAKEHFDQNQWFAEQCQCWAFVDTYGSETTNSTPKFKTKAALANNRGAFSRAEVVEVGAA